MNNISNRGDSYANRLVSFFQKEWSTSFKIKKRIKEHVFLCETDEKKWILKAYKSKRSLGQQISFFKKWKSNNPMWVQFRSFPDGRWVKEWDQKYWVIMSYVSGQSLSYTNEEDRKESLEVIQTFHHQSERVRIKRPILRDPLYLRYYQRLNNLEETESYFTSFGYQWLYMDIVQTCRYLIQKFEDLPWSNLEDESLNNGTWIHGDVASHNFIRRQDGLVCLIDFDLLSFSPHVYDYIQFGQRFIPWYEDQESEFLSLFEPYVDVTDPFWQEGVAFPADILREWIRFIRNNHNPVEIKSYLKYLEVEWKKRKKFVESFFNMLS
ncbi:phosphotransferase [Bacillaceae bacterium S4-13-56]